MATTSRKRFERLLHKPVEVRELEVEGSGVTIWEGIVGQALTERRAAFESPELAEASIATLVTRWRAEGFVAINRFAIPEPKKAVKRGERLTWVDEQRVTRFVEIRQSDSFVRIAHGFVLPEGNDEVERTESPPSRTVELATVLYDKKLAELVEVRDQAAAASQRAKLARKAKKAERRDRNANPELERQCREAGDTTAPWRVYAEHLIAAGDPIGEAAVLALDGDPVAARAILERELAVLRQVAYELRNGFVHHVELRGGHEGDLDGFDLPRLTQRVLQAPCCRFVSSLRFGLAGWPDNNWAPTLRVVCGQPHAAWLRELRFDAFDSALRGIGCGDLGFAWSSLPRLEVLRVRAARGNLGALDLPNLRELVREASSLGTSTVRAIVGRERPHLEHLELWLGSTNVAVHDLAPLGDRAPGLRHLGIVNSELSDDVIPMLVAASYLPRLRTLDLSRGVAGRAFADQLVAAAAKFRHLDAIDLSGNLLEDADAARIAAVLPNADVSGQRHESDGRFVAVSE